MRLQFDEIEGRIPSLMPMDQDFESAYINIKGPMKALAEAGEDEASFVIFNFLEQLDFLINHSFVNGTNITFADVKLPFELKPLCQKKEVNDDKAK